MLSLVSYLFRLLFARLGLLITSGDERDAEILSLRHQIRVLQRQVPHPRFTPVDRAVLGVLAQIFDRRRLEGVMLIVKCDTVIGWHKRLVARRWTCRRFCCLASVKTVSRMILRPGAIQ